MTLNQPKLAVLIGTRPGIIKMSVVYHAILNADCSSVLIHSGQHYSALMDEQIMQDVELPAPDFRSLRPDNCITHAAQTAFMLVNIEQALIKSKPNLLFVCGDANTNLAGALAARKLGIPLAHVEAGLRSYDWRMPEEHNRRMIDHISDLLFAPTPECVEHLRLENVMGQIFCVGNTVADSALRFRPKHANKNGKVLLTLHREENVDNPSTLQHLLEEIGRIVEMSELPVEFLIHPRTRKRMKEYGLWRYVHPQIDVQHTVGYREMLQKITEAEYVLTDSGGLQEEACILGTPCYTLRKTTERPETVECGANVVLGIDQPASIFQKSFPPLVQKWESPYGNGDASKKIVDHAIDYLSPV